ncbi:probable serine/threonine-protein kinase DDB_G0282963 [Leptidea sinapis]|uniref:probable serine/threonine-protein kinase DDB_G0282963 n=1 Tax=Leptidea sinapis TaxID=189913 RepID=UPI0021263329|nr:probable serine/threonine-protein kinase DDB_G0282963 [Leptidea sinapis]
MYVFGVLISYVLCVYADDAQDRRTKLPYIADAIGNSLPRPSNLPATVGSPVNLLTPDRYEFYTFDESGELVKRLMTLEEIQAIVAAGEDTDGLVTFANDDHPTVAFNFSQPSYNKVHNVVTNVQNVLKAQMEAHKNNPKIRPTLDTPDVSDSWSLILPSIFGNTGVDIVPDKSSGSFITPETDTLDFDTPNNDLSNVLTKEVINTQSSTSTPESTQYINNSKVKDIQENITAPPKNYTKEQSTQKPIPVHLNNETITNNFLPSTVKPHISTLSITKTKPTSVKTEEIAQFGTGITSSVKHTTPRITTVYTTKKNDIISNQEPQTLNQEFIPVSMISHTTVKSVNITPIKQSSTPSGESIINVMTKSPDNLHLSTNSEEYIKDNSTTLTTQSVSPSTTISSTEIISTQSSNNVNVSKLEQQPIVPLFDVAQSISQIASDLGNNFVPVQTTNNENADAIKLNMDMESKENIEIDIPSGLDKTHDLKIENHSNTDNIVKISQEELQTINTEKENNSFVTIVTTTDAIISTTESLETTTVDNILSESMSDLLSQVVYQGADERLSQENNSVKEIYERENINENKISESSNNDNKVSSTTEMNFETTTYYVTEQTKEDNWSSNENTEATTTESPLNEMIGPNFIKVSLENDKTQKTKKKPVQDITTQTTSTTISQFIEKQSIKNNNVWFTRNNSIPNQPEKSEESVTLASVQLTQSTIPYSNNVNNIISNSSLHNKVEIHEFSEVKNKSNKTKISGDFPKVDEFKKKIQKINIDDKELANERNNSWKLIPSVPPPKYHEPNNERPEGFYTSENSADKNINLDFSKENQGLEVTTKDVGEDITQFIELCNELAFQYWNDLTENTDKKRSFVLSPYSITSMLAMMFMGARGATSGEMNEVLKLDDMFTFNPHFTLKNISDSIDISPTSGIAASAFIRELYSDRSKGKILTFYKERAQHFYNGHVEEVNFKLISDIIRRRTNLLVKRYTWGKITEFLKSNNIMMNPPLAAFSANIFQTDCTGTSVDGRDGEMYFVVSPTVRQRRLVPVPAVVYRSNFLAGYDPILDATAAALGNTNSVISTLFLMPGQQGNIVHADDLEVLEKRLLGSKPTASVWNRLLRTLLPRVGLELQIPRFSHKSVFNISASLQKMGLKDLFNSNHADLGGLNGPSKNLYLTDMVQLTSFVTCGEGVIGEQHHIEEYPETLSDVQKRRNSRWLGAWNEPRDYQRSFHDPHDLGEAMNLPLHLRPRQARLPARSSQPARLKYDRPFLFFVRHNPSGMILYVGRYNPRLLP